MLQILYRKRLSKLDRNRVEILNRQWYYNNVSKVRMI